MKKLKKRFPLMLLLLMILVSMSPSTYAATSSFDKAYVPIHIGSSVNIIDLKTDVVENIVDVGTGPVSAMISPDGTKVLISVHSQNKTLVLSTSNSSVIATINTTQPTGGTFNGDGSKAYISSFNQASVYIIDMLNNYTITDTLSTGRNPSVALYAGDKIYIPSESDARVDILDVNTKAITSIATTDYRPFSGVLNNDYTKLYLCSRNNPQIVIIDLANGNAITQIPTDGIIRGIELSSDGKKLYAANSNHNRVDVIDTVSNTVTASITDATNPIFYPIAIGVSPDGTKAYTVNRGNNTVSVIDLSTETVVKTLSLTGGNPDYVFGTFMAPTSFVQNTSPSAPSAPVLNTPLVGNSQVTLSWNTVSNATAYDVYSSTSSGSYTVHSTTSANTAVVSSLTNGTPYYFVVRATNAGGSSGNSNEVTATPLAPSPSAPSAPVLNAPLAGDSQVTLSWNTVSNATAYDVYSSTSSGSYTVHSTTSANTAVVSSLTNGTPYYFVVRATNAGGSSGNSNEVTATPLAPSNPPTPSPSPSKPSDGPVFTPLPIKTDLEGFVNDDKEILGTMESGTYEGQNASIITLDADKIAEKLSSTNKPLIKIPVTQNALKVIVGRLNGQMVKDMETQSATLEIDTGKVIYMLPADQIDIDAIAERIGQQVELKDIEVNIKIADASDSNAKIIQDTADAKQYKVIGSPVNFEISSTSGGQTFKVSQFKSFIERRFLLPDDFDPSQVPTGVVLNSDGSLSPVPTSIMYTNEGNYAKINSLTNSNYALILNPVEVASVSNHWSKDIVNRMASSLIIENPQQFSPDKTITRGDFVSYLTKALGLDRPNVSSEKPFNDVAVNDDYADALTMAKAYNLIGPSSDGNFNPNDTLTRQEAMVMLAKAIKLAGIDTNVPDQMSSYQDLDQIDPLAYTAVQDAVNLGIVKGRSLNRIAPNASLTYSEALTMLNNLLVSADLINF